MHDARSHLSGLLLFTLAAACGGEADPGGEWTAGATATGLTLQQKAAIRAAFGTGDCADIGSMYAELGDASGIQYELSNDGVLTGDSEMSIASASKWVYGTYRVASLPWPLPAGVTAALSMSSGYEAASQAICAGRTIAGCRDAMGVTYAGKLYFNYDGGPFMQDAASTPSLATLTGGRYTALVNSTLGTHFTPEANAGASDVPGGMVASSHQYGEFLRAILTADALRSRLGAYQVQAWGGPGNSPAEDAGHEWNYALGYWVELDLDRGYSSPGKFGFYGWISADKTRYMVIARHESTLGVQEGVATALCAYHLRSAGWGPTADAGAGVSGNEGATVTFDGSRSAARSPATIASYAWDFGDGATATGAVVRHVYADDGNYLVTLTVRDSGGLESTAQVRAQIANVAPTVRAGGPYAGNAGVAVTLDGTASDPSAVDQARLVYVWTFGDGTLPARGASVSHTYAAPGVYSATLTVSDGDGGVTSASAQVTVRAWQTDWLPITSAASGAGAVYGSGSTVVSALADLGGATVDVAAGTDRWLEARFGGPAPVLAVGATIARVTYRVPAAAWTGDLRLELWSGAARLGSTSLVRRLLSTTIDWDISSLVTVANAGSLTLRVVDDGTSRVEWAYAGIQRTALY